MNDNDDFLLGVRDPDPGIQQVLDAMGGAHCTACGATYNDDGSEDDLHARRHREQGLGPLRTEVRNPATAAADEALAVLDAGLQRSTEGGVPVVDDVCWRCQARAPLPGSTAGVCGPCREVLLADDHEAPEHGGGSDDGLVVTDDDGEYAVLGGVGHGHTRFIVMDLGFDNQMSGPLGDLVQAAIAAHVERVRLMMVRYMDVQEALRAQGFDHTGHRPGCPCPASVARRRRMTARYVKRTRLRGGRPHWEREGRWRWEWGESGQLISVMDESFEQLDDEQLTAVRDTLGPVDDIPGVTVWRARVHQHGGRDVSTDLHAVAAMSAPGRPADGQVWQLQVETGTAEAHQRLVSSEDDVIVTLEEGDLGDGVRARVRIASTLSGGAEEVMEITVGDHNQLRTEPTTALSALERCIQGLETAVLRAREGASEILVTYADEDLASALGAALEQDRWRPSPGSVDSFEVCHQPPSARMTFEDAEGKGYTSNILIRRCGGAYGNSIKGIHPDVVVSIGGIPGPDRSEIERMLETRESGCWDELA